MTKIWSLLILSLVITSTLCARSSQRLFVSEEVDKYIEEIKNKFQSEKLASVYENTFPNTLDTTVYFDERENDTFIITGDINAMWLRDSSFQALAYVKFAKNDKKLKTMMRGLIKRHVKSIKIDVYANAFNYDSGYTPWMSDKTDMNGKIWERKYELDSTISTLFFAYNYFKETEDCEFLNDDDWYKALDAILQLVKDEMRGTQEEDDEDGPKYTFNRQSDEPFESLHQGRGNPAASCGLVKSSFRNSDDAATFPYSIPENAFLSATFIRVSEMLKKYTTIVKTLSVHQVAKISNYIEELESISLSLRKNIYKYGVFKDQFTKEKFFAYEIDCFGSFYFIDDAGYPSLISLPFIGFIDKDDPLYLSTRKRILSIKNPYYYSGSEGDGVGSSHTYRFFVWPLFVIMRALTTDDQVEIQKCIDLLLKSAESTGFMHESFFINSVNNFTRSWFAWANSFFGLMINDVNQRFPNLLLK